MLEFCVMKGRAIGLNLPSENDGVSFGGFDEEFDSFELAFIRIFSIIN